MTKKNDSAERVKQYFTNSSFTPMQQNNEKQRNFKLEKTPPLPKGIDGITPKNVSNTKRPFHKIQKESSSHQFLEQLNCSSNQNYPLDFILKAEALQARKVKNMKVKERLIASRNLQKLSQEMQQWMYAQIHRKIDLHEKHKVEFYHLIEQREERHFRIDRIIKYLSDP